LKIKKPKKPKKYSFSGFKIFKNLKDLGFFKWVWSLWTALNLSQWLHGQWTHSTGTAGRAAEPIKEFVLQTG